MNEYVIDANILFSAVIRQKELYERLTDQFILYTPDFALSELQQYRHIILQKTKSNSERLRDFTILFFRQLIVLPDYVISDEALNTARLLCEDIDLKDSVYVALSVELNLVLLTRDKPLHDGLKQKGYSKVQLFDEFVRYHLGPNPT